MHFLKRSSNLVQFIILLFLALSCDEKRDNKSRSENSSNIGSAGSTAAPKSNGEKSSAVQQAPTPAADSGSKDDTTPPPSKTETDSKSDQTSAGKQAEDTKETKETQDTVPAKPALTSIKDCPKSAIKEIPELDFELKIKLNVGCGGATQKEAEAAKVAAKLLLARIRVDNPHIYKKIKDSLGDIVLCGGTGGQTFRYYIPQSCADEFRDGFDFQYTNYVHEFAHIIHFAIYDTDEKLVKQLDELYKKEKNTAVSNYAKGDVKEFFAESTTAWFNLGGGDSWAAYINHESLKKNTPTTYKFLESFYCKPADN
ncbi:MAG: hypothetical protein HQK54_07220 [Oligoflexales bacterium]|nr:hypothetical protein [Oligoflexales bacterium]